MDFTKLITQASDFVWGLIEEKVTERLNAKAEEIEKKLGAMTEGDIMQIVDDKLDYGTKMEDAIRDEAVIKPVVCPNGVEATTGGR